MNIRSKRVALLLFALAMLLPTNVKAENYLSGVNRQLLEYLNTEVVEEEVEELVQEPCYTSYSVPSNNGFKSYMPASAITSRSSPQYKLKAKYELSEYGIYTVDGRYCVAVGSYYTTKIGAKLDLVMENGSIVPCILADCKADRDTDSTNRQNPNGSITEFIVYSKCLVPKAKQMGDCSYCFPDMQGEISEIRVYED